ncbi:MAG: VOC family protein [Spirochaetia bacterium]|nr:VOC family protein [Spirochaetia bacterium]
MDSRISFITIGVKDFKTSLSFYKDTIGFKLYKLQGDIAMFDMGGTVLAIYPLKLLAEDAALRIGTGFGGIALAYNVKLSKDVDRVLGSLQAKNAKILKPAEDTFWGGRSGYFADPDGYPWEVAWNPFIKMDSKGKLVLGKG